jgi:hypothetical protein
MTNPKLVIMEVAVAIAMIKTVVVPDMLARVQVRAVLEEKYMAML